METCEIEFVGQELAEQLALALVRGSIWFEMTPLPDDYWEVSVRADIVQHVHLLLFAISEKQKGAQQA